MSEQVQRIASLGGDADGQIRLPVGQEPTHSSKSFPQIPVTLFEFDGPVIARGSAIQFHRGD